MTDEQTAHNMGFSAMLAEEYILIDISLSSVSGATFLRNINGGLFIFIILFIFNYRAGRDTEYQHSRKPWPLCAIT